MPKSPNTSAPGAPPSATRVMQILIGLAAVALVVGSMLVLLLNAQIGVLQKTAADKESKVGDSEQIARRYEATQATFAATQARAQYLEASVSAKSYVPTMLLQLQGLASSTHLIVNAVHPGVITPPVVVKPAAPTDGSTPAEPVKSAPPPPYDTLTIDVDVTGTYSDTVAFLYGLTRFPKIVSVTGVQIKPGTTIVSGTTPSGPPTVSTSLHLMAFVFHDAAAPASSPTNLAGLAASAASLPRLSAPSRSDVSDAAAHAASHAIGASKAAQSRSEVGIATM